MLGLAEQVTNVDRLNESTGMIYAVFVGKAAVPMSGYVWVDVRDIALAHVLAIVSYPFRSFERTVRLNG